MIRNKFHRQGPRMCFIGKPNHKSVFILYAKTLEESCLIKLELFLFAYEMHWNVELS